MAGELRLEFAQGPTSGPTPGAMSGAGARFCSDRDKSSIPFAKPRLLLIDRMTGQLAAWLERAVPEGYEDETGFHLAERQMPGPASPAAPAGCSSAISRRIETDTGAAQAKDIG